MQHQQHGGEESATPKKRKIVDPVEARVELINGQFDLPAEALAAMKEVRLAISEAARKIRAAAIAIPSPDPNAGGGGKPGYDVGRLIAALDALQHAKDIACVSFILPHATTTDAQ